MVKNLQILDRWGEVLREYKVPEGRKEFEGAIMEGAELSEAQLPGACFRDADLYWVIFFMANLDGADFENANLQGADLKETSCVGASFRNANIGKDNLGGCSSFHGADLSGAIMNGAKVDGAEYNEKTKFPKGFYPDAHGMVYVGS